jgi:outer membrane murein-binding lipoprotein Lpp
VRSVKLLLVLTFVVFLAVVFVGGCVKAAAVKDKFVAETSTILDTYAARIDDLAKEAQAMPSPAKEEAMAKIDLAKAKLAEGKAKLEELKGAGEDRWEALMSDIAVILTDLVKLYNDAAAAVM